MGILEHFKIPPKLLALGVIKGTKEIIEENLMELLSFDCDVKKSNGKKIVTHEYTFKWDEEES